VTEDRGIARNSHIAEGSAAVWEEALRLIREAVESGNLGRAG
jgi:putative hydrolase of HD superfamily